MHEGIRRLRDGRHRFGIREDDADQMQARVQVAPAPVAMAARKNEEVSTSDTLEFRFRELRFTIRLGIFFEIDQGLDEVK